MKLTRIASLLLAGVLGAGTAQAGIGSGSAGTILTSKEKCASALNNYLSFRHGSNANDAYKIQKLENQVDALCDGYQVNLVESNGMMTGVVELAE